MTIARHPCTLLAAAVIILANYAWAAEKTTPSSSPAEDATRHFKPFEFKGTNNQTLRYRLMVPENYDPSKKYPLVIFLHGSGERGSDNARTLENGICQCVGSPQARSKFPCFALIPQCPTDDSWTVGNSAEPVTAATSNVLELVRKLEKEYSLDSRRYYVGGLSMGGYGTWNLITYYPELFAAAFPIAAGGRAECAPFAKDVPIWAFHGQKDPSVPAAAGQAMVDAVNKAGGNAKYTEYPGVGHNSWTNAFKEPQLLEWLFAQKRSKPGSWQTAALPAPKVTLGYPVTLPSSGEWTGTAHRTGHSVPRLLVQETPFRLKPADKAADDVKQKLAEIAQGKIKGKCKVSGTAVLEEKRLWILVESIEIVEQ